MDHALSLVESKLFDRFCRVFDAHLNRHFTQSQSVINIYLSTVTQSTEFKIFYSGIHQTHFNILNNSTLDLVELALNKFFLQ